MNITGSARCHTSIVLIAWWTDLQNEYPSQEPEMVFMRRVLLTCEMTMNFVMMGKCIDADPTSLKQSVHSPNAACLLTPTMDYKHDY